MRHSRLFSSIVAATLALGLGTAMAVSEESASAPVPSSSNRAAAELSLAPGGGVAAQGRFVTAVSVTAPVPAAASSSVGQSRPVGQKPAESDRDHKDFERLRLRCEGMATDTTPPVIACRWSASEAPRFAGYRLVRGDGDGRSIVFQTRDRSDTSFVDHQVRPGATYHYVVQVLGPQGQVIGMSERSTAQASGRSAGRSDKIRLACEPVSRDRHRAVACKWSDARSDDARGYALVRSIDGGPGERVFQKGIEGPNHHIDGPLRAGHRYTYVVVVLDEAGEVIGHSDPVTVGWPSSDPPVADVASW